MSLPPPAQQLIDGRLVGAAATYPILNPATGEQRKVKYKSAAGLLAQGWNLVED